MISFLVGNIEEKGENTLVLDVGGVGYSMFVSSNTLSSMPMQGEVVKVYTHLAVREDDVSLFGFSTKEERDVFYKLIEVSGVGPKLAISILSGMALSDLVSAIIREDIKLLSTIKGLGKKTAEHICVELKGKMNIISQVETNFAQNFNEDAVNMATDTLISLGINKNEAYTLARSVAKENDTAEEIISKALRGYRT